MSIMQSDTAIRTALILAIAEIRKRSFLLDDIFAQLVCDPYLKDEYGYREIQRAKKWFLETDIGVVMDYRMEKPNLPCISISIEEASEMIERTTLGDEWAGEEVVTPTLIDPSEYKSTPIIVLGPFIPKEYDPVTGILILPSPFTTEHVVRGQFLKDKNGNKYEILDRMCDDKIRIATNITRDLSDSVILPRFEGLRTRRYKSNFRESYMIMAHVAGDPVELIWLYSILVYCLLRFKQEFLNDRGIELSTFRAGPIHRNDAFEMQNVWSRAISFTGVVEYSWIGDIHQKIDGVYVKDVFIQDATPTNPADVLPDQSWKMPGDE